MNPSTNPSKALTKPGPPSAIQLMAARCNVDPLKLYETLKTTIFPKATEHELLALVVVSNSYGLNPFLREIFAFPGKNGGIVPMVPIDGWTRIVNRQNDYDGMEFSWEFDEEKMPVSCTCTIYIKGRSHPVIATEFYEECVRNTDPWKQMPRRMLRHKAFMQTARLAFGFSGIQDEDEARDIVGVVEVAPLTVLNPPAKRIEVPTGSEDEAAEAAAGLAPEQKAEKKTLQAELEGVVVTGGFTFDVLQKWLVETGNFEAAGSLASFSDLPNDICTRLLRAKVGLIKGLAQVKGAA